MCVCRGFRMELHPSKVGNRFVTYYSSLHYRFSCSPSYFLWLHCMPYMSNILLAWLCANLPLSVNYICSAFKALMHATDTWYRWAHIYHVVACYPLWANKFRRFSHSEQKGFSCGFRFKCENHSECENYTTEFVTVTMKSCLLSVLPHCVLLIFRKVVALLFVLYWLCIGWCGTTFTGSDDASAETRNLFRINTQFMGRRIHCMTSLCLQHIYGTEMANWVKFWEKKSFWIGFVPKICFFFLISKQVSVDYGKKTQE